MNYGRLQSSPRLRRALKALYEAKGELSTLEWAQAAQICAVNSVAAELRANGAEILCERRFVEGHPRYFYTLLKLPKDYHAQTTTD